MRAILFLASLLVLPLALLLFAQWPLREVVQAYSRQANDVAQVFFALYVAVAITAASRAQTHLAAGLLAHKGAPWRRWALLACVLPWVLFMLWAAAPQIQSSLMQMEKFGETLTPGFFIVKLALGLMLVLVLVDVLLQARAPESGGA